MIHKLKRKFTVLATVSMLVLMAVLVTIINLINYSSVVAESDAVLDVLSQPNAPFFEKKDPPNEPPKEDVDKFIPHGMSPEVPYESRFFSVTVSSDGSLIDSDFSKILSVDDASVKVYIEKAVNSNRNRGFIGQFRYAKTTDGQTTRILFLDCGRKLDAFTTFLWTSLGVGLLGCVIVFVAFLFVAGKIVKPIAESYEKQKRFISDAGHEIKTPLTIISANVDLLESDGEKEELTEIRTQTKRLATLTKDLVFLSKMEEQEQSIQKIECPLSDLVSETANSFHAPTVAKNIAFQIRVQPNVTVKASPDALRQLVSVLMENAVKYTPDGGIIHLEMLAQKKAVLLSVQNTTKELISRSDLPHLFDRFYRTDASRNSATGGHGIGLSIAKAIVEAHNGSISASTSGKCDFEIKVTIPF